jgi:hypothetical protein
MQSKDLNDKQLLEEAYEEILLNELNWKGMLAAGAMATAGMTGGAQGDTMKSYTPKQSGMEDVYSNQSAEIQGEDVKINSVKKLLEKSLNNVSGSLYVEIIESKGLTSNSQSVLFSIDGDVIASSQEEADQIVKNIILKTLKDANISVVGLKSFVTGADINLENIQRKFKINIKVKIKI